MKKTSDEMGQLIMALEQVFDVVRLINPTQLAPCIENAFPSLAVTTNPIYLIYHGLMAVFLLNNLSSVRRFHVA